MLEYSKNNKLISYVIILIWFFVLLIFTKDIYVWLTDTLKIKDEKNIIFEEKNNELIKLEKIQKFLYKNNTKIKRYNIEIKEDEILDYIYAYLTNKKWLEIHSLNIQNTSETEIWFKQTKVELNLLVRNENKLLQLLDYLVNNNDWKYGFFLESFTFPYGEKKWDYNVTIPLKLLHK
jgi:hypothetical protein